MEKTPEILLKGQVFALRSKNSFTDGKERMTICVQGCDSPLNTLQLPRPFFHGMQLDEEYEVILRKIEK
jgi:hypothetical protein